MSTREHMGALLGESKEPKQLRPFSYCQFEGRRGGKAGAVRGAGATRAKNDRETEKERGKEHLLFDSPLFSF